MILEASCTTNKLRLAIVTPTHTLAHPKRAPFVMLMAAPGRRRDHTLPQFPHDASSNVRRPRLAGKFCTSIIVDGRTGGRQTDRQTDLLAGPLIVR